MKLIYTPAATKALRTLPRHDAKALQAKLETFAASPFALHPWAKAFGDGISPVRHGDWRAVCLIDQGEVTVIVVKIGNRKEIYR